MYNVIGEKRLDELELPHLPGYENSRPVRIGNAAHTQLQIDIYGELADVIAQARAGGLAPSPRSKELRGVFMRHLEKTWPLPDEGIWEIRGAPQHFVHSKVMAWVAFDRAQAWDATPRQKAHWKKVARFTLICKNGIDKTRLLVRLMPPTDGCQPLLLPLVGSAALRQRIRATVRESKNA
jgi:GH15 family glucan-1,4-alpha-glucosidase